MKPFEKWRNFYVERYNDIWNFRTAPYFVMNALLIGDTLDNKILFMYA